MTDNKTTLIIFMIGLIIAVGSCVLGGFFVAGSVTWWWVASSSVLEATNTHLTAEALAVVETTSYPTFTPSSLPSATPTPTPLPSSTSTATAVPPTVTNTVMPIPPTSTPTEEPPTITLTPTQAPPTVTPQPTPTFTPVPTPTPAFSFVIAENAQFSTNHLNFDVYVAITDANNMPLGGHRVLGTHSTGLQVDSQVSANDWTVNSGAMHYKGGNMKYEVFNSPTGLWLLQLVDENGQAVAPVVEFSFDANNPSWYFLLYRRTN